MIIQFFLQLLIRVKKFLELLDTILQEFLHGDANKIVAKISRKRQSNSWENFEKAGLVLKSHITKSAVVSQRFRNKTRTSKVGAISKAQKAQNIFFEKNLKFSKKIF